MADVYKSFSGENVLAGINLEVFEGESVVLFGPSGCGKTTLLKLCDGLMQPDQGEIWIDGERLSDLDSFALDRMRQKIGMNFQYYALFDSMTVEENIGFYLMRHTKRSPGEIRDEVNRLLELVDLPGINHLKPSELSGGMQRRVGIARAIIHRPKIMLYDSPTDGLDPVTANRIIDLILDLRTQFGVTSITISNDMQTAFRLGMRLAMLYRGKIVQIATPDEIRNTENPIVHQFVNGLMEGPIPVVNSECASEDEECEDLEPA